MRRVPSTGVRAGVASDANVSLNGDFARRMLQAGSGHVGEGRLGDAIAATIVSLFVRPSDEAYESLRIYLGMDRRFGRNEGLRAATHQVPKLHDELVRLGNPRIRRFPAQAAEYYQAAATLRPDRPALAKDARKLFVVSARRRFWPIDRFVRFERVSMWMAMLSWFMSAVPWLGFVSLIREVPDAVRLSAHVSVILAALACAAAEIVVSLILASANDRVTRRHVWYGAICAGLGASVACGAAIYAMHPSRPLFLACGAAATSLAIVPAITANRWFSMASGGALFAAFAALLAIYGMRASDVPFTMADAFWPFLLYFATFLWVCAMHAERTTAFLTSAEGAADHEMNERAADPKTPDVPESVSK